MCDWEILTPEGFMDFDGIYQTPDNVSISLITNGPTIKTTPEHQVLSVERGLVSVCDLKIGEEICGNDIYTVKDLIDDFQEIPHYDVINVKCSMYVANKLYHHNCLALDEFAFVQQQQEFFTSVFPTISSGKNTKVIVTSTPNGLEMFYKLWKDSENKRNAFVRVESKWNELPGRDKKWMETQISIMGEEKFSQEHEAQFLGSSKTLISGKKLRQLNFTDPIEEDDDHHTRVYEQPLYNHDYVCIADCAEGTGLDSSAVSVIDITKIPYKLVCVYTNSEIPSSVFPTIIYRLAERYGDAMVLIENNSIGSDVARILHDELEYENVLMTESATKRGVTISFSSNARFGVRTTTLTKRLGCEKLKSLIESNLLTFDDYELIHELSIFCLQANGTYKATEGEGNHDDIVMTLVLFGWLQTQEFMKSYTNHETDSRQTLQDYNAKAVEEQLLPVALIDKNMIPEEGIPFVYDVDAWINDENPDFSLDLGDFGPRY